MRRRRPVVDPLADVPEHLRSFPVAWREVAAQGPDGLQEAFEACARWSTERRAWQQVHGYRGSPLEWLRTGVEARRGLYRAAEAWQGGHSIR